MEQFKNIFIDDVKSLKRDNLYLKLRVQELENEMETIKRMLKIILTKNKPTDKEASVIQRYWKSKQIKKNNINKFYLKYIFFKKWCYNIAMSLRRQNAQYVTCTPINLEKGNPLSNYNKQVEKYNDKNCQMRWDDNSSNNSVVGNLFAFVKSNDEMQIHLITKIGNKNDRELYWSDIDRNVVFLSKDYFIMSFNNYKNLYDYSENYSLRATARLKWH